MATYFQDAFEVMPKFRGMLFAILLIFVLTTAETVVDNPQTVMLYQEE